jgi:hypothetical protein
MVSGLAAEFDREHTVVAAAAALRARGYAKLEAYGPYHSVELDHALGRPRSRVPYFVLGGGLIGAALGYAILYWTSAVDYSIDVGGRPAHAVPAFVPITFETAVLIASLSAVGAFLALSRLPRLHHPIMEIGAFPRTSTDRFLLVVGTDDQRFDRRVTRDELLELEAVSVEAFGALAKEAA